MEAGDGAARPILAVASQGLFVKDGGDEVKPRGGLEHVQRAADTGLRPIIDAPEEEIDGEKGGDVGPEVANVFSKND